LLDNPEIMDEIEGKIREKFKQNEAEAAAAAAPKKKAETSKLEKLANESAGIKPVVKESEDAQEDFEEFAPVDISNLGD
jgi:recombination protein RecA